MGRMRDNHSLAVLAVIGVIFLLYWGEAFFVPLFVSLFISYALSPVVSALTAVVRLRALAAAIVVTAVAALVGLAAWSWSDDVVAAWQQAPAAVQSISKSLQQVLRKPAGPITEMKKAAADLESVTQTGKANPSPQPAAAAAPVSTLDVMWRGWKTVMSAGGQLMVVFFLVFFMLASGDFFKLKLLAIAGERDKRRFTRNVLEEIDAQVRRYLAVVVVSNVLVGIGVWLAFLALGVKYAALWGVIAGGLHTAPYFGPALVAAASLVAAFVQFENWSMAIAASAATIGVATVVGMVFTTWLASRQTQMNTTAAFVGLLFFGWIWGFWGLLLGIPLLAIAKTVCDHNEDWKPIAELLGR